MNLKFRIIVIVGVGIFHWGWGGGVDTNTWEEMKLIEHSDEGGGVMKCPLYSPSPFYK